MDNSRGNSKNIILAVVIVLIVGVIWYIEAHKPASVAGTSVALTTAVATSTSTSAGTSSASGTSTAASGNAGNESILADEAAHYPPAQELILGGDPTATGTTPFGAPASSGFINTAPFTLKSLIGKKVVLIDFWTYSCINCLRTLPYVEAWNAKYENYGLEIIGVHSPEFDFEKSYSNVSAAVKSLGVTYPVVQDNNMDTWNAYDNEYWPADYLIDINGYIVHNQIGEGDYNVTEEAIQSALKERAQVLGQEAGESASQIAADIAAIPTGLVNPSNAVSMDGSDIGSPETYFGSARNEYLANGTQGVNGTQTLIVPDMSQVQLNSLYLGGIWNFQDQYAESAQSASAAAGSEKIVYQFDAKNMYIVAASQNGVKVKVLIDGKPITAAEAGADVAPDGTMTIQTDRLYSIYAGSDYGQHTLELDVEGPGLDAYTFTFG